MRVKGIGTKYDIVSNRENIHQPRMKKTVLIPQVYKPEMGDSDRCMYTRNPYFMQIQSQIVFTSEPKFVRLS